MPEYVKKKLMAFAKKKGMSKKKANSYTYGAMNKRNLLGKT